MLSRRRPLGRGTGERDSGRAQSGFSPAGLGRPPFSCSAVVAPAEGEARGRFAPHSTAPSRPRHTIDPGYADYRRFPAGHICPSRDIMAEEHLSSERASPVGLCCRPRSRFAADIVSDYTQDYGSVGVNSMPIYRVPAGQPGVAISVLPGCNDFLPDTGNEIPVPDYVTLTGTSDSPLVVYQPSTDTDWELWRRPEPQRFVFCVLGWQARYGYFYRGFPVPLRHVGHRDQLPCHSDHRGRCRVRPD